MINESPALVTYDITYECNLSCNICQTKSYTDSSFDKGHMPKEKVISSAQRINDETGVALFRFIGAEPLLHPDIVEIIQEVSKIGQTWITTNGTLLTEDLAEKLCAAGLSYIVISLDGPRENSSQVRGAETFDKAFEAVKAMDAAKKKSGSKINIVVNNTITKHNYNKMLSIGKMLKPFDVSIGANSVHSMRKYVKDVTFDGVKLDYLGDTPEPHSHLTWFQKRIFSFQYHMVLSQSKNIFVRPFYIAAAQLKRLLVETKLNFFFSPCVRPSQHLNIRNDGEIYPCEFLRPYSLGSIEDETIWKTSKREEIAQELAKGKLQVCRQCSKQRLYN